MLLLDEPFSALDKNLRASMQVELKEIQRKLGVTTIFVTHDQSEALSLSDRIAVMSDGRIRQLGTPDEIYRRPVDRFVASFVGDVNVLHARLERIDGATAEVALGAARVLVPTAPLQGAATGDAVDLFVRPEDLRVAEAGTAGRGHTASWRRRSIRAATSTSMSTCRRLRRDACCCACPEPKPCRSGRSARASRWRSGQTTRSPFRAADNRRAQ